MPLRESVSQLQFIREAKVHGFLEAFDKKYAKIKNKKISIKKV